MKVALINAYKDRWKEELKNSNELVNSFYQSVVTNWQQNWNVESSDLAHIYDVSLQSKVSGRLWGGSTNSAKSMMITLIGENDTFIRSCFRDLFNEKLDLGLRLDRFGYHVDQVFRPMMSKNPKLSTHYHNDREILCLYLAMEYPDEYCLFDHESFRIMMTRFESRNPPSRVEVERYYKSCRGINKLITKDEELVNLVSDLTGDDHVGLIMMSWFMEYVSGCDTILD